MKYNFLPQLQMELEEGGCSPSLPMNIQKE